MTGKENPAVDPAAAEEAGSAPASDTERAAADRETLKTPEKVNLNDMPPSQDDEIGGPRGPEPTRYGDWERKGRVSDF